MRIISSIGFFVCVGLLSNEALAVRVVTTTTDLAAITKEIAGDRVDVEAICAGTQDPHYVRARPSYMVKLNRADLVIAVGLDLEIGWLPALVQGARNPKIMQGRQGYLEASAGITAIDVPTGEIDRSAGDVHPQGNPHYWLDPENARHIAHTIANRLSQIDPDGAAVYAKNLSVFHRRMDQAMKRWNTTMARYRGMKVVSYHRTFNYFLQRFRINVVDYVEDRPGIPPAAAHLSALIRTMGSERIEIVLHETYFDRAVSELVAQRSGASVVQLPTSVNGVAGVKTYEQLIDHLVAAIDGAGRPKEG